VYFANITALSAKAWQFIEARGGDFEVVLWVEHHLRDEKLVRARKRLGKLGWSTAVSPAAKTEKGGTSGGAAVLVAKELCSRGARSPGEGRALEGSWAAAFVRIGGLEVAFVAMYLRPGDSEEENLLVLEEVSTFLGLLKAPFVVAADWNQVPVVVEESGWPRSVGGVLLTAPDLEATCNQGEGRILDYLCVSSCLAGLLEVRADSRSPWSPHAGLCIDLALAADSHYVKMQLMPKAIVPAAGPCWPWEAYRARVPTEELVNSPIQYPVAVGASEHGLTVAYLSLSWAFEEYLLDLAAEPLSSRSRFRGRGAPPVFAWKPVIGPSRPGAVYEEPRLCFWSSLLFRLREAVRCKRGAQPETTVKWLAGAAGRLQHHWLEAGRPGEISLSEAQLVLSRWGAASGRDRALLLQAAKRAEEAAFRAAAATAKKGFRDWLSKSLARGGGQAHRWAREPDEEHVGDHLLEVEEELDETATAWEEIWSVKSEAQQDSQHHRAGGDARRPAPGWKEELRRRALAERGDLEPLRLASLNRVLAKAPVAAGRGLDLWRLAELDRLPPEGKAELLQLLQGIEMKLAWPAQALALRMAKLAKPGGGHRLIGLTSCIYRAWSQLRRPGVVAWEELERRTAFWDSALQGSSCLRVALARAMQGEAAKILGASFSQLLWDIRKFYDSIRPWMLAELSRQLGYPAVLLYLGLLVHEAARIIFDRCVASRFVVPEASILAGCMQSTTWAKIYLHDILHEVHHSFAPVRVSSWIDDLAQLCVASRAVVVARMAGAAVFLQQRLRDRGCHFAPKSFAISADATLNRYLVEELAARGVVVQAKASGRDLGIDVTLGTRRSTAVVAGRRLAAEKRLVKAGMATKAVRGARALATVGAWPQLAWGRQAVGTSLSETCRIRARLAKGMGIRRAGGCVSSAFELDGHRGRDPAYCLPLDLVQAFVQTLVGDPSLVPSVSKALGKIGRELADKTPQQLWHFARGPISSFAATLQQHGWQVLGGNRWQDDLENVWEVDLRDASLCEQLSIVFEESVERQVWRRAARHRGGRGGESGVDFTVAKRLLAGHHRHSRWQEAAALQLVVQGAAWPEARLKDEGYDSLGLCSFCGAVDDEFHFFWGCSRHRDSPVKAIVESNPLLGEAAASSEGCPVLWLRGLPPKGLVAEALRDHPVPEVPEFFEGGVFAGGADYVLRAGDVLATDGSGGPFSADPRLRRASFAVVVLSGDLRLLGFVGGTVTGKQTTNRAELVAVLVAHLRTSGSATVVVDSSYVQQPFAKDTDGGLCQATHLDLWAEVRQRRQQRQGELTLFKIRSHLGLAQALAEGFSPRAWLANHLADAVAGYVAEEAQPQPAACSEVAAIDGKARAILRRLVAVIRQLPEKPRLRASRRKAPEVELGPEDARGQEDPEIHRGAFKIGSWRGCTCCRSSSLHGQPLPSACTEASQPARAHPSHTMVLVGAIWVCTRCGGWAKSVFKKLESRCREPTHSGSAALQAFGRGQKPQGLLHWG